MGKRMEIQMRADDYNFKMEEHRENLEARKRERKAKIAAIKERRELAKARAEVSAFLMV